MMRWMIRNQRGFTLMELLIAVAILAVLAAIGVPVYTRLRGSAKHAEAYANLDGIRTAEEAYKMANGTYLTCPPSPRLPSELKNAGNQAVSWKALDSSGNQTTSEGFALLGFEPNSEVRFVYEVEADLNNDGNDDTNNYFAGALGDTDADSNQILIVADASRGPHVVDSSDTIPTGFMGGEAEATDTND